MCGVKPSYLKAHGPNVIWAMCKIATCEASGFKNAEEANSLLMGGKGMSKKW